MNNAHIVSTMLHLFNKGGKNCSIEERALFCQCVAVLPDALDICISEMMGW